MIITNPTQTLKGDLRVSGSKSHTIRALAIALLANGNSTIRNPLTSGDGLSAFRCAKALGAEIEDTGSEWIVKGCNGKPVAQSDTIDLGNSGTSLRIMSSIAALQSQPITFVGDESLQTRPMQSLLDALSTLGATVESTNGCAPLTITGPIQGGSVEVLGKTSQFVSSLLITSPVLSGDTTITVENLNEKPYVEITLRWLKEQNITYTQTDMREFHITGGQAYQGFDHYIAGDWSSAAFPLAAAALLNGNITVSGIDLTDSQGDKAIVDILAKMGATITPSKHSISIKGEKLIGGSFDLNATPDLLPILSVLGCFAKGKTELKNVAQARIKETDRIAAMSSELRKLGAQIEEKEDGMIIYESTLKATEVDGHHDHRIIMSLACLGLALSDPLHITNSSEYHVTFPTFFSAMKNLGANLTEQ